MSLESILLLEKMSESMLDSIPHDVENIHNWLEENNHPFVWDSYWTLARRVVWG